MMAQEIQLDFLSEMISHGWYLKINLLWLSGNHGYSKQRLSFPYKNWQNVRGLLNFCVCFSVQCGGGLIRNVMLLTVCLKLLISIILVLQ